jgi:putative inorganic carbon (hco3(-)) transporter
MAHALLIVVVLALLAPLALALRGNRAAAGTLILFLLLTRLSDLGISAHGVSAVSPAGLSQVSQICLVALAAVAAARRIRGAQSDAGLLSDRPWLAMGIYVAVVLASSIWAAAGQVAASQAVSLLKNLVIAYVIVEFIDSSRALRLALWGALAAGTLMAGLTVMQAATHTYENPYFGLAQAPVRQLVGLDNSFRSAGPIGDPNFYALVLAVLMPVALMRLRDETRPSLRLFAGATALLLLAAIVLTYSRGGLVTAVAAVVLFVSFARVRAAHVALALVVAVPLVPLIPTTYWARINTIRQGDDSIASREASQAVALQMFTSHPLGGVGANNYPVEYFPYALSLNKPAAAEEPHNLYLAVAAETGLLGITTFIAAQALVVRYAWRQRRIALNRNDRPTEGLVTTAMLMLLTYLVGVAFLPIAYPRYLWLLVGLALVAPVAARQHTGPRARRPMLARSVPS